MPPLKVAILFRNATSVYAFRPRTHYEPSGLASSLPIQSCNTPTLCIIFHLAQPRGHILLRSKNTFRSRVDGWTSTYFKDILITVFRCCSYTWLSTTEISKYSCPLSQMHVCNFYSNDTAGPDFLRHGLTIRCIHFFYVATFTFYVIHFLILLFIFAFNSSSNIFLWTNHKSNE